MLTAARLPRPGRLPRWLRSGTGLLSVRLFAVPRLSERVLPDDCRRREWMLTATGLLPWRLLPGSRLLSGYRLRTAWLPLVAGSSEDGGIRGRLRAGVRGGA
jgi:hypothetical protein